MGRAESSYLSPAHGPSPEHRPCKRPPNGLWLLPGNSFPWGGKSPESSSLHQALPSAPEHRFCNSFRGIDGWIDGCFSASTSSRTHSSCRAGHWGPALPQPEPGVHPMGPPSTFRPSMGREGLRFGWRPGRREGALGRPRGAGSGREGKRQLHAFPGELRDER